jgi:hypothetical protein
MKSRYTVANASHSLKEAYSGMKPYAMPSGVDSNTDPGVSGHTPSHT